VPPVEPVDACPDVTESLFPLTRLQHTVNALATLAEDGESHERDSERQISECRERKLTGG
jgi:hypothetical protein